MFGLNKPLFGVQASSSFGAPASSSSNAFSFNAAKTTTATGFGFGMQPTTAASAFSFGGLSAPSTTNIFGGTSTSKSQPFGFSSSKTPSLFGNPPATSIAAPKPGSLFSFQPTQQNQPILGQQTTSAFGLQNNSILQQQQQQLQQQQNSVNAFYASLSQPLLFGDERDNIITRLNQLQAMLGTGTGYSALGAVTYTMENPFSRFRGIAYNVLPASTEADGLVCLAVNLPTATVLSQKQGLQDHLFRLLGGRPNFQLIIEEIRPSARSETNTEVVIKVVERQASGSLHTIPASDLANYLCSPTVKQELQSQLCVSLLTPELAPSTSQLNVYLETPPAGLDRLVWQQARADNPAPDRLIPVPVVGFADLKRRRADQLLFADQQRKSVKHLLKVAGDLRTHHLSISQKISQLKRKQIELNHRVLKLLAKQTVVRRAGFAISADEEALRSALEHIWTELTSPRGLRARIQQLLPTLRASNTGDSKPSASTSAVDVGDKKSTSDLSSSLMTAAWWQKPEIVEDLKEYLNQRNNGIKEMRSLLMELTNTLRVLTEKQSQLSALSGFHTAASDFAPLRSSSFGQPLRLM